ncbi:MAG: DUF2339 domain-containing protein [Synergistaceae bacterium]|jgi:uncharacterized membrane protein|nr:DUF2339 domain-containing protein [Synergistaceae bacterium]
MDVLWLGEIVIFALLIASIIMISNLSIKITAIRYMLNDLQWLITKKQSEAPPQIDSAALESKPDSEPAGTPLEVPRQAHTEAPAGESINPAEQAYEAQDADETPLAEFMSAADHPEGMDNETLQTAVPAHEPSPDKLFPPSAGRAAPRQNANTTMPLLRTHIKRLTSWLFTEGNIWVTVGVLLFMAGFGLLFNYVHRKGWIPLEIRLSGAGVIGVAMAAFGWKMRNIRRTYSLILQGGGIGVLYIVLLAGVKLGPVIPVGWSIFGMFFLSTFTAVLAMYQDFEPLALFALLGGYAAPILVSSGSSNFVALFSIYSLLNLEVFVISLGRDWRKTRWSGMAVSVAVGTIWGILRWRDEYFASVEPFLILFFINYSAVSFIPLFRCRLAKFFREAGAGEFARVDTPMIMTLPFIFLFLQMAAASHTKYGVAVTCLSLGAWYIALASYSMRSAKTESIGIKPKIFLVYCILFSNMAVPFIFRQALSSCVWAIEGTLLTAYAAKYKNSRAMNCGITLHIFAFLLYNLAPYLHLPYHLYGGDLSYIGLFRWRTDNPNFLLTSLIFAASAFATSYFINVLSRNEMEERYFSFSHTDACWGLSWALSAYGTWWWTMSAIHAGEFTFKDTAITPFIIMCVGAAVAYEVGARTDWRQIRFAAVPPFGMMLPSIFMRGADKNILLDWIAMTPMAVRVFIAYRNEGTSRTRHVSWCLATLSVISFTSLAWSALSQRWFGYDTRFDMDDMRYLAGYLPIFASALLLLHPRFKAIAQMRKYRVSTLIAITILMAIRLGSFIISTWEDGDGLFSVYIPLINPLELWQILYLTTAGLILYEIKQGQIRRIGLYIALPAVVFLWLNSVAARAAWQYFGEMVRFGHMAKTPHFQAIIAILWGMTSLALIYFGKKYANRYLWFTGAALLTLDIVKLLLLDLRNSATVIRIFAFLLLGGFFLLIGWIAPLPPIKKSDSPPRLSERS